MRCILLLALSLSFLLAEDPFAGLQFTDGKARTAADFAGRNVAMLYVCSHCPSATGFTTSKGKQMANEVEKERLPGFFIVVVPQEKGAGLKAWQKAKGIENALVATDPANKAKISLNNIIRLYYVDGQGNKRAAISDNLLTEGKAFLKSGDYKISKEGLSDDKALTLW